MNFLKLLIFSQAALAFSTRRLEDKHSTQNSKAAVYLLENNPAGNNIVCIRTSEGFLHGKPVRTTTGGYGSFQTDNNGTAAAVDTLGSQGTVTVSGDFLFTVNAGSNTLSMFSIDHRDPCALHLVGKPSATQGDFPISVDYSPALQLACTLNGGSKAGLGCFNVHPFRGLSAVGPLYGLPAAVINETTPPSGPPGSAAQVAFRPDSSSILVSVKGNAGSTPVKLGSLVTWNIEHSSSLLSEPTISSVENNAMSFGFSFISNDAIFVADPSYGASILDLDQQCGFSVRTRFDIANQTAICWTQYDSSLNSLYAFDAGSDMITTIDANSSVAKSPILVQSDGNSTNAGLFDSQAKDGILYSLAKANGVIAVDLRRKRQTQFFDLSALGVRQYLQGLALWPATRNMVY